MQGEKDITAALLTLAKAQSGKGAKEILYIFDSFRKKIK